MMTIRQATLEDTTAILRILIDVAQTSPYARCVVLDIDRLVSQLNLLMPHPDAGFLLATQDGAIHGLLVLMLCDDLLSAERLASEVCWYVDPGHRHGVGVQLLTAGETWARARGATRLQMLAPAGKFESAFRRRGYVPTDRIYERRL